jgi:hypothetical protein
VPPAPETKPPAPETNSLFAVNLAALVAAGVAVSWWLLCFTDWFETFAGLLTLGGVLSWLAFVSRVLPEDQLKALQRQITGSVMENERTWKFCLAGLLAALVVSSFVGSLQIEGGRGGSDARLKVFADGKKEEDTDTDYLPANGRVRSLWFVWPFSGSKVRVKVAGLPVAAFDVRPWWRAGGPEKCLVPTSFLRPVLCVAATGSVAEKASTGDPPERFDLVVCIDGKLHRRAFTGRAVWVGCRKGDLELPASAAKYWEKELADPEKAQLLFPPDDAPVDWSDALSDKATVSAWLAKKGENTPQTTAPTLRVRKPEGVADMVQYLRLESKQPR